MEMRSRTSIQERDESTVLVRQHSYRLDLSTSDMAEKLLSRSIGWNVTKIDSTTGASHPSWSGLHHGLVLAESRATEAGVAIGRLWLEQISRDHTLVKLRRHGIDVALGRARYVSLLGLLVMLWLLNLVLLVLVALLVMVVLLKVTVRYLIKTTGVAELRRAELIRRARLEGTAQQKLGG